MEQTIKVTKNKQLVLQGLLQGPGSFKALRSVANPSGSVISDPRLKAAVFDQLVEAGWAELEDGLYKITEDGVFATNEYARQQAAKPQLSVASAEKFVSTGLYDGAELRREAYRPGAFDYLKCPSVINGVLTPYFVK